MVANCQVCGQTVDLPPDPDQWGADTLAPGMLKVRLKGREEAAQNRQFCKQHRCRRCENQRHENLQVCQQYSLKCQQNDCHTRVILGYCPDHIPRCQAHLLGCTEYPLPQSTYCSQYECTTTNCRKARLFDLGTGEPLLFCSQCLQHHANEMQSLMSRMTSMLRR